MTNLFLTILCSLFLAIPAKATIKVVTEGVSSSNYVVKIDTVNRIAEFGNHYVGSIPTVGVYSSSNLVVGQSDHCVIYSSGSLGCIGSIIAANIYGNGSNLTGLPTLSSFNSFISTTGARLEAVAVSTKAFGTWQSTVSVSLTNLASSTTTLNTEIVSLGASTQSLAGVVGLSTQTLGANVGSSTTTLMVNITSIGASTQSIVGVIGLSTQTLGASIGLATTTLNSEIVALGLSTQTIVGTIGLSTQTLGANVGSSTTTIYVRIVSLGLSTQTFAGTIGLSTQTIVGTIGLSTQTLGANVGSATTTIAANYVPYTGATGNVTLGNNNITAGSTQFGTSGSTAIFSTGGILTTPQLRVLSANTSALGGALTQRGQILSGYSNLDYIGTGATNGKIWDHSYGNTNMTDRICNDGVTACTNWLVVTRSVQDISQVSFPFGKFGIGDTTPDAQLEVLSTSTPTGFIVAVSSQNDTTGNILAITGNGYIGIGNAAPSFNLDVTGYNASLFGTARYLTGSTSLPLAVYFGRTGNELIEGISAGAGQFIASSIAGDIFWRSGGGAMIWTGDSAGNRTDLYLTATGLFGINDASPDAQLEVVSNTAPLSYVLAVSSQSDIIASVFGITGGGHVVSSGTTPGIACNAGTGAMLVNSNDMSGAFTAGTLAVNCTITFVRAWAKAPVCMFMTDAAAPIALSITARSTTAVTVTAAAALTGDTVFYHCWGAP